MELRELLIELTMGAVWINSGIILLLVKNKSDMYAKSYFTAKKYMIVFLFFSGITTVVSTVWEMLFDKGLECFCIITLLCRFAEAILLLLSLMSLFNHEGCLGRNLWRCFSPFFILVFLYFGSKFIFEEPEIYSVMELLRYMHLSPPIAIRFLIEFSIITGVGIVVYKYVGLKKEYLSDVDSLLLPIETERLRWIDKMVVLMILIGGLSVLDSVITWKLYLYIDGTVSTGGVMYCVISFINYRSESVPALLVTGKVHTDMETMLPDENNVVVNDEENETQEPLTEIDENYYYTKKAVDKWLSLPDKPYLKGGITLKDAALGAGVSRRRLSDYIKSEYSCNFNTWINTLRIEEVKRYLLEEDTNLSLSYIADQTGFSDLAGMSNTFKKVMGIPPSLFRKEIVTKTIHEEMGG